MVLLSYFHKNNFQIDLGQSIHPKLLLDKSNEFLHHEIYWNKT